MPRFFIEDRMMDGSYCLPEAVARHATKSLRMKEGDELTLCTPERIDLYCTITSINGSSVMVKVDRSEPNQTEPKIHIHLYQCLPKGDKMELVVQKAVELGVASITLVLSSRCISRPDAKSMDKKQARFQKIALEAAEQSGRGIIPPIHPLLSFEQAVKDACSKNEVLFCYERATQKLSETPFASEQSLGDEQSLALFVGSEGGFSEDEADFIIQNGAKSVSLGARILRTETAPLAALAALMYRMGEL